MSPPMEKLSTSSLNVRTKHTIAALTARQYRANKKKELEDLKLQLELFKNAYLRYKDMYEKSQKELNLVIKRYSELEQTLQTRSSFQLESTLDSCAPTTLPNLSPCPSAESPLPFDNEIPYNTLDDPIYFLCAT
uniref:Transforming growth factor beta regulator 1 n=1 Tax=Mesocestoides corti TaxID=53468 RepID=A0A5K3EY41_MESCO